ncbi:MAG: hypothetical protein ACI8WT_004478 [Clostridium sp.]|jgi:hypothetical protein
MKNNKVKDERVIEQQHKIVSSAYQLVSMFLLVSILYKQFILNEPFKAYMTEFIAFFGGSLYIVFGNVLKGNDVYNCNIVGAKKHLIKRYILNSLVTSSVITVVLVMQSYPRYSQNKVEILIVFLVPFILSLLCSWGLSWFSKKRTDNIAKQYEENEDI